MSRRLRLRCIRPDTRQILVTYFPGSDQAKDFTTEPNCGGIGRIRHFHRHGDDRWVSNPLPIDPARRALRLRDDDVVHAQVFQNACCNWRCWYCFVDFALLSGNQNRGRWATAEKLIDLYLEQDDRPQMIDLTGGQPDLVPEWIPWIMEALQARQLDRRVYLWSDDNLSTDFFWRYLSEEQRSCISSYQNYGKVCCFKGFCAESFHFNTMAEPQRFEEQFRLFSRNLRLGLDLYGYVTLTTDSASQLPSRMRRFVDRLQAIHPHLPLRVLPLKIDAFSPVRRRLDEAHELALTIQYDALNAWQTELSRRFTAEELGRSIVDVSLA